MGLEIRQQRSSIQNDAIYASYNTMIQDANAGIFARSARIKLRLNWCRRKSRPRPRHPPSFRIRVVLLDTKGDIRTVSQSIRQREWRRNVLSMQPWMRRPFSRATLLISASSSKRSPDTCQRDRTFAPPRTSVQFAAVFGFSITRRMLRIGAKPSRRKLGGIWSCRDK